MAWPQGITLKNTFFYDKGPYWQIKFDVSKLLTWQDMLFKICLELCDFLSSKLLLL